MVDKLKALLAWCKYQCRDHANVNVCNFTSSWKSGLAFCAIIHRFRPDLINYDSLLPNDTYGNCKLAFSTAQDLGIPALLDAEDMQRMTVPDRLCIITYVSQYYNYFSQNLPKGGKQKTMSRLAEPLKEVLPLKVARELLTDKHPGQAAKLQTLEDRCCKCQNKVYLLQRQLHEGKLYHRHCVRQMTQEVSEERARQVSSIRNLSQTTDPTERERAREVIMKSVNKLMPQHTPSYSQAEKENVAVSSQKGPVKVSSTHSENHLTALPNSSNTKPHANSCSEVIVGTKAIFESSTPATHTQTDKHSNVSDTHSNTSFESKPKDNGAYNVHASKSQPSCKFSSQQTIQAQTPTNKTVTNGGDQLVRSAEHRPAKAGHFNVYSKPVKSESVLNNKHLANGTTSSVSSITFNIKVTTSSARAERPSLTSTDLPRQLNYSNSHNDALTATTNATSSYMNLKTDPPCLIDSVVDKSKKVDGEVAVGSGKTEWQLEVERRQRMRKGVYEDPEFKGRRNEPSNETKMAPDPKTTKASVDLQCKVSQTSVTVSKATLPFSVNFLNDSKSKSMFDSTRVLPSPTKASTPTSSSVLLSSSWLPSSSASSSLASSSSASSSSASMSTQASYTSPIFHSNTRANSYRNSTAISSTVLTNLPTIAPMTTAVRLSEQKKSAKEMSPKYTLHEIAITAPASTIVPTSTIFSFSSSYLSSFFCSSSSSSFSTPPSSSSSSSATHLTSEALIVSAGLKAPLPPTTQTLPHSKLSNSTFYAASHLPDPSRERQTNKNNKAADDKLLSSTTFPPSTTSSDPAPTSSTTSTLPSSPTTTNFSNLTFSETLFTSPTMKEAAKKGVFAVESFKMPQRESPNVLPLKRDYIDVSKYKRQASIVSKRKVSTEVHIAYKEIDDQTSKLLEELLMVEERGRQLEESIRQHGEKGEEEEDDDGLMKQWLQLVRRRNDLMRRESDLCHKRKQQEYDELHEDLEYQLRILLAIPDAQKSPGDTHFEEYLIRELQKIVHCRDQVVHSIESDREKYLKEDEQLECLSAPKQTGTMPLEKKKKKGRKFKRLFQRRNSSQTGAQDALKEEIAGSTVSLVDKKEKKVTK